MILRDFVNGLAHLAEQHGWFVSNMRFGRDPDVADLELEKKIRDQAVVMAVRIDDESVGAVVEVDGTIAGVFGRKIRDGDILDAFERFCEEDHYSVYEISHPLTERPVVQDNDYKITINPLIGEQGPWQPDPQKYQQPYITWGGGTGDVTWGGNTVSLTCENSARLQAFSAS